MNGNDFSNRLYNLGYIVTNSDTIADSDIGVDFSKWYREEIDGYKIYVHPDETYFSYSDGARKFFLIGHAYNPFTMESEETVILKKLSALYSSKDEYLDYFDQLTGLFVYFVIENNKIIFTCDCAGMMGAFYLADKNKLYVSSHCQMIADILKLKEDPYITRMKKSKTFHLYGWYWPGDYTSYEKIKRVIPNTSVVVQGKSTKIDRFYPRKPYHIVDEKEYDTTVETIGKLLHNNMALICKKWDKPAVSLTGGVDSQTTLACASDVQKSFEYYSYISLPREATDAYAAKNICDSLGLSHRIFNVDESNENYPEYDNLYKMLCRHYAYLGAPNDNDVRKRIVLSEQFPYDIEVKSWVSEVARASRYGKYNKNSLPSKPTPKMLTSMYKIFTFDRLTVHKTDKIFKDYLTNTHLAELLDSTNYPWSEFFVWEIVFGGWGGLTLSSEHKVSNNITVPFNNRAILDIMLRTPLEKRKSDTLHLDIIEKMDPALKNLGILVVNGNETKKRAILEGLYFDIHSHLPF